MKMTKEEILSKIQDIIKEKEEKKEHPTHVMINELYDSCNMPMKELKHILYDLVKRGRINYGHTINSIYFKLYDYGNKG